MVNNWLNSILSWSLTSSCQLCGSLQVSGHTDLCSACYEALPWLSSACPRCANPLPATGGLLCGQCQQAPPVFTNSLALFRYEPPLDRLIQDLKFHGQLRYARLLGTLMAEHLGQLSQLPDCIIPVPLHRRRLRERGFNQALELARPIARQLDINIDTRHCQRVRYTHGQADLPLARRQANVRRAFRVDRQPGWRHVAIIDDVMTSGQTVNALARAIQQAGVETISVWCCCRATLEW